MADRKFGAGFLGELGTRLQRLLNFDGEPGATFSAQAIPVLIVGDGTMPGYANQSGRRWGILSGALLVGGSTFMMRATQDLIVECIWFAKDATANIGTVTAAMCPTSQADPAFGMASNGIFLDRMVSVTDRPTIRSGQGFLAPPTRYVFAQAESIAVVQHPMVVWDKPFCLGSEVPLLLDCLGAQGRFYVAGRTL